MIISRVDPRIKADFFRAFRVNAAWPRVLFLKLTYLGFRNIAVKALKLSFKFLLVKGIHKRVCKSNKSANSGIWLQCRRY